MQGKIYTISINKVDSETEKRFRAFKREIVWIKFGPGKPLVAYREISK